VTDRRPLILLCRARRRIHADGEIVEPGELVPLVIDLALAAVAAGSVEVVGPEAERVRTAPACVWSTAATPPEARQPGGWMTPPADVALADSEQPREFGAARGYAGARPRRGLIGAMEMAAQRWRQ
jgi:hypothetical protein